MWIPKRLLELIMCLSWKNDFFVPGQFLAQAADLESLILKTLIFLNYKCL